MVFQVFGTPATNNTYLRLSEEVRIKRLSVVFWLGKGARASVASFLLLFYQGLFGIGTCFLSNLLQGFRPCLGGEALREF